MSDFRVFETDEFLKKLKKILPQDAAFLRKKLDGFVYPQIKEQPFWGGNIKKLRGYSPDTWRYRIGRFRVFYLIDQKEKIIYILTVENRKDAYK
ncbi:MAG: type II toxin-antitoxin system RelE/ParE family toxin [Candidatus Electrothrix sp. LOE2]|nr:type II toxin-antitoxin system RelE/ParE family toxin [Candidatus Electrothrix sp. LOE2]